jgi:hypothetical protein
LSQAKKSWVQRLQVQMAKMKNICGELETSNQLVMVGWWWWCNFSREYDITSPHRCVPFSLLHWLRSKLIIFVLWLVIYQKRTPPK